MKKLVEKGLNAIVFAMLFTSIAFVLDTLTPSNSAEIYELYGSYLQVLWFFAISFVVLGGVFVTVAIASKFRILMGLSQSLKKHYVTLGFLINGLGLLCAVYFLIQFAVFPW
jgi:hypothetical protein